MRFEESVCWVQLTRRNFSKRFAISVASLQRVILLGGSRQSKVRIYTGVGHDVEKISCGIT